VTAARSTICSVGLAGALAGVALFAAGAATAAAPGNGILNQTQASDVAGDSGTGPDLSSLTVTSYTDGTVSFAVGFANRTYLESGETVQIFIDLNDDGQADLNLSVWPSYDPSYLDRWTGSSWTDIRQLPELVEAQGSISVRLSLSELQSDGAVPVAPIIQVAAGSYSEDATGMVANTADDWLPSATGWVDETINPTSATGGTQTVTTTPAPAATRGGSAPRETKPTTKTLSPPVTIEPIAPITVKRGEDVTLHVRLESRAGSARLFKVCATLQPQADVPNATQCRSTEATGGSGAVLLTITYKIDRPGTAQVSIDAAAGSAKASASVAVKVLAA